MQKAEQKLVETVDRFAGDILDFTCRLVAQPSTLENETPVMTLLERHLAALSFQPRRVPIDPHRLSRHPGFAPVPWPYEDRWNVTATRPPEGRGGRSAIFNGHLDVVSAEPLDQWDRDPFEPYEHDGWLFGRGAGDMKSGVAAMIYAVKAVDAAGFGLRAPVTIEAVIEEECGGNGALACVVAGPGAEAVLIPEPMGMAMLTAQLGVLWFKVRLTGVPRHVYEARAGVNAIEKCIPLIGALRRLESEMNARSHPAYAGIAHPIHLNIGIIRGGDWPSTVPAHAEFHCRLSFFPDETFAQTRRRILATIERAAVEDDWLSENPPRVEFYGFRSEGHVADRGRPLYRTLDGCHRELFGRPVEEHISTATTDVRAYHHFGGAQATCYGPEAKNIHAANECVRIESVAQTARVYALFLARWCGLLE